MYSCIGNIYDRSGKKSNEENISYMQQVLVAWKVGKKMIPSLEACLNDGRFTLIITASS
jgi:hypothetical protein